MAIFTANNWRDPPEGTVLQYRMANSVANWTNSSTQNWFEVLNYTITPKFSSSHIWIQTNICGGFGSAQNSCMKLVRNSTDISVGTGGGRNCAIGQSGISDFSTQHRLNNSNYSFVDAPNTTSTVTYRVYLSTRSDEGNASWRFNQPWDSNNQGYNYHGNTNLILVEIAQ